jgi:hypothetical protein
MEAVCSIPNLRTRHTVGIRTHLTLHQTVYKMLVINPEGKDHLGDPGVHGKKILIWIINKQDIRVWTGFIWLRIGCSNET